MFIFNRPFAAVLCALGVAFLMPYVERWVDGRDAAASGRAVPENVLTFAPPDESRHFPVGPALEEPALARMSGHEQDIRRLDLQRRLAVTPTEQVIPLAADDPGEIRSCTVAANVLVQLRGWNGDFRRVLGDDVDVHERQLPLPGATYPG